jgi:integrase/recombinase XerC
MSHALAVVDPVRPLAALAGVATPEDILAAWLGGKSPLTVAAYRRDLETFRAHLAPHGLADFFAADAGTAHAIAHGYRAALLAHGHAPAGVNRKLSALRSAVSFARMVGAVAWTLELPGVESTKYRDTRGPGAAGYRAMLAPLAGRADAAALRDAAVLHLLFDLALRRGEVVGLDVAHADLVAGTLAVLGKKRLERERLTLPAPTRAALAAWLAVRGDAPGPLFTNFDRAGKGGRLTGRSVARIVAAAGETAGLGTVRPHGLRHAAITHALDLAAGDVRRVARFSRHRDIRTLTVYDDNRADLGGEVAALVAGAAA